MASIQGTGLSVVEGRLSRELEGVKTENKVLHEEIQVKITSSIHVFTLTLIYYYTYYFLQKCKFAIFL